ncbi:MAG: HEPN domain-containing protein [Acidobacteriota bacterium]
MPHDPARIAETREWLQKAALDFRGAHIDLEAKPPLLEDALFHCQQAVEKALKGFLAWHDVPFRKTHSLEELGASCEQVDPALKAVLDPAVPLTEFAWAFRYPGDHPTPTNEEARQGHDAARRAVAGTVARLPEDAVPATLREQIS